MTIEAPESVDDIIEIWNERGDSEYGGEPVTQLEHALQAALLAERESAPAELIVAALLHDFGHLVHDLPDDAPDQGIDDRHEHVAKNSLGKIFPQSVIQPIQLHVEAKRFLCHTDKSYFSRLSEPSVTSLNLQGGPMTEKEVEEFKSNQYWQDAVRLRQWDDEAKIPGLDLPDIDYFRDYMQTACLL